MKHYILLTTVLTQKIINHFSARISAPGRRVIEPQHAERLRVDDRLEPLCLAATVRMGSRHHIPASPSWASGDHALYSHGKRCNKNLKLCGSIDMIYEHEDGRVSIYDWKRCKEIKTENYGICMFKVFDFIKDVQ